MSDKISIILPCRNSGEHLRAALNSIIDNTEYPSWELIIVDSSDDDVTRDIIEEFLEKDKRVRALFTPREGITKALNKGIREAGDNDVYLTEDDVVLPNLYGRDWLTIINKVSKLKDCGVVTTIAGGNKSDDMYVDGFHWAGTWSLYVPRRTLEIVGLFEEDFSPGPGDDIDYSYRVHKAGLRILVAPFWVDHHRLTENFNESEHLKWKNAGVFKRKHGLKPVWYEVNVMGEFMLWDERTRKYHGGWDIYKSEYASPDLMNEIKYATTFFKDDNAGDDDVFIDIGANTGVISLMMQKGICLAFEADPSSFDVLKTNALINKRKRIAPFNVALYDSETSFDIDESVNHGYRKIELKEEGKRKTQLLDDFLYKLDVKGRIRLIKIDVEGAEINVLRGAIKTLKKHSPTIIIETKTNTKDIESFLIDLGYEQTKRIGEEDVVWERN